MNWQISLKRFALTTTLLLSILGLLLFHLLSSNQQTLQAQVDSKKLEIKKVRPQKYEFQSLEGDLVEIGIKEYSPPIPYIKLNKWDGETFVSLSFPTDAQTELQLEDGKVKWIEDKIEAHIYPLEPEEITEKDNKGEEHTSKINENGGLEWETVLKEKPESNVLSWGIETQGLKFYYQPELTKKEKDEGAFRPEHVIGSYAVYHEPQDKVFKTKEEAGKYKIGKAFHIYRPQAHDAKGNEIWGELKIDTEKGFLTINIDQDWLDNATYPVRITGTNFGYETIGSSYEPYEETALSIWPDTYIIGSKFPSGGSGTADSITAFLSNPFMAGPIPAKCAIYDSSLNLVGQTDEVEVPTDGQFGMWVTFNFSAPKPSISNADYWLVAWAWAEGPADPYFYYDEGEANQGLVKAQFWPYGEHPDFPNSITSPTYNNNKYSIYATYTAAPSNNTPTNDSLTFTNPYGGDGNDAVADNTTEWNFRAVVSDTDGYTNLGTVVLRLANSSDNITPFDSLKFTWTESTDTFSETADTQNAATITSTGSDSTCATNTCTLDFKIKFNSNFSTQSTNYNAELYTTDDAAATDEDSYTNFYQVVPISISISSPADVSLGTITGTGTSSTGEATWTVTTNNPNGYKLEWQASTATMTNEYSDTIAAYTPAVADTPETWSVASSDSEWGGRLKSTSTDYASGTWGVDDTTNAKWLNVKSSALFQIASRASTTTGSNEIVQFKAEVGSSKFQPTGTYTINVTVTATTL